jgi:ABC-type Fe3+ transport system permease subunit
MPAGAQRPSSLIASARMWPAPAILITVSILILWPLVYSAALVIIALTEGAPTRDGRSAMSALSLSPLLLARTLGWAAFIGILAAILAIPGGLCIRRWGWAAGAPALAAMAVPTYLAFSGWGMARAPGTWIGNQIELLSQDGARWLPIAVGTALAVVGLALWAAPLAALIMGAAWRRIDPDISDALRLEPTRGRAMVMAGLGFPAFFSAAALVAIIMFGSAVPLHLARVETYSIRAWLELSQTAANEQWRAAAASWPLILAAVFLGWTLAGKLAERAARERAGGIFESRRISNVPRGTSARGGVFVRAPMAAGAGVVIALGVLVPLGLFLSGIPSARAFTTTLRASLDAFVASAVIAGIVGLCASGLAACAWAGMTARGSPMKATRFVVRVFVIAALLPGIIVGWSVSAAWNGVDALRGAAETPMIVIAAHVARYGALAMVAGVWLAAMTPREEDDLCAIDGAIGFRGWVSARLRPQWGALAGVGIGTAALSLHEIESAIFVQPIGIGSFARQMLDHLHFFRTAELSSLGTVIVALAAAAGTIAAVCIALFSGRRVFR